MLASLLPGLRDLRTPLATGYLWVVALWLLLHNRIPDSVEHATGPIKSLYQLGTFVGDTAVLAALSFVAYLLGSMLRLQPRTDFSGIIRTTLPKGGPIRVFRVLWAPSWRMFIARGFSMYLQLRTFMSTQLRQLASDVDLNVHHAVLEDQANRYHDLWSAIRTYKQKPESARHSAEQLNLAQDIESQLVMVYAQNMIEELPAVGIQLQAKNRDFWDTYDRQLAEAQFRYGIAPPMAVIIVILAWKSGDWWWLLLLAAPVFLFILSYRHLMDATSTLVQAVVLKMVEPPVVERLREAVAKKRVEEKFVGGTRRP
jgi:hypothetical protein